MTVLTTKIGQKAEKHIAEVLQKDGFKILALNWKTKICEIDIVAMKNGVVYFVEVKYRSSETQGRGFEYITPAKLRKVHFAAEVWAQQNKWSGDYRILAAEVSDDAVPKIVEVD
jgi:Holliday junction resolvase-like predicted endonuclease